MIPDPVEFSPRSSLRSRRWVGGGGLTDLGRSASPRCQPTTSYVPDVIRGAASSISRRFKRRAALTAETAAVCQNASLLTRADENTSTQQPGAHQQHEGSGGGRWLPKHGKHIQEPGLVGNVVLQNTAAFLKHARLAQRSKGSYGGICEGLAHTRALVLTPACTHAHTHTDTVNFYSRR